MPFIKLQSNLEIAKNINFIYDVSKFVADILHKPEKYVMVELNVNPNMSFGGSNEPLIYCELKSIGLPAERTREISKNFMTFLEKETGIPKERMYIEFSDAKRNMWGWNGSTFE